MAEADRRAVPADQRPAHRRARAGHLRRRVGAGGLRDVRGRPRYAALGDRRLPARRASLVLGGDAAAAVRRGDGDRPGDAQHLRHRPRSRWPRSTTVVVRRYLLVRVRRTTSTSAPAIGRSLRKTVRAEMKWGGGGSLRAAAPCPRTDTSVGGGCRPRSSGERELAYRRRSSSSGIRALAARSTAPARGDRRRWSERATSTSAAQRASVVTAWLEVVRPRRARAASRGLALVVTRFALAPQTALRRPAAASRSSRSASSRPAAAIRAASTPSVRRRPGRRPRGST